MQLTVSQLAQLTNRTERAVRKAIASGKYVSVKSTPGRGRGGINWTVSAYDPAIPDDVRRKLGIETRAQLLQAHIAQEAKRMDIKPERIQDENTTQRLRVMQLAQAKPQGMEMRDWLSEISRIENVSVPTIYRWLKDAKRGKVVSDRAPVPVALEAESGPIRIQVKSRSFAPQAMEYGIALLMNNPHMDTKTAYMELAVEAEKNSWDIGSMPSFYRAVSQLPPVARILTQRGKRGLEAIVKPPIYRDITKYEIYEELVGDQHIFDYTVLDDDNEPIRPEMFVWGDTRSRYLTGVWPVMGHYDKYAVGMSLREACRWGVPQILHTDWGKPECSKYVGQLRSQLAGYTAFKDGDSSWMGDPVTQTKSKPRNAQAKPIESWFFHAFERPLMQKGLPGYSRRDFNEKKNEYIQAQLRGDIKKKHLLHAKDFFEIVFGLWMEWNSHTMFDGSIPEEVFMSGIERPGIYRFTDETLDFLFLPAEKRKVTKSLVGVTLPGIGRVQWHSPKLSGLNGRSVEIRYNPYEPERAYILDAASHEMIDIAEQWKITDPHDQEAFTGKIRRQNQILKYWIETVNQLSRTQTKVHKISPYAGAAAQISSMEAARETLVVNAAEVDEKIISLSAILAKQAEQQTKEEEKKWAVM